MIRGKGASRRRSVKVPDNRREHPQRGINKADIVFVEPDGYQDASGHGSARSGLPLPHGQQRRASALHSAVEGRSLLSPIHALMGNTGASPWVVNYVERYCAHLEGLLSYMNTLRTGSYGIDRSRVYTPNGDYYYDKAVGHPAVLARQTKRFRSGPPLPSPRPARSAPSEANAAARIRIPIRRQLLHGLRLRQEKEALSRGVVGRTCCPMGLEYRLTMCS